MNKLPVEINSEMKIFGVSLTVLLFAAAGMFIGSQTKGWIYAPLQTPWIIFNILVWFLLGLPSPINRGKRLISSVYLYLSRDDKTYTSIPIPRKITDIEPLRERKVVYVNDSE
jgi:hypothetical protein